MSDRESSTPSVCSKNKPGIRTFKPEIRGANLDKLMICPEPRKWDRRIFAGYDDQVHLGGQHRSQAFDNLEHHRILKHMDVIERQHDILPVRQDVFRQGRPYDLEGRKLPRVQVSLEIPTDPPVDSLEVGKEIA